MDKDEQIVAMANFITEGARQAVEDAEALYNAGYRLATEVAEEIFAEIEKRFMYRANDAYKGDIFIDSVDFAELKKKYTEGEK